jgi:hypothetical protein
MFTFLFTFLFIWKVAGDLKFGIWKFVYEVEFEFEFKFEVEFEFKFEVEFEFKLEVFLKKCLGSPCYLMVVSGGSLSLGGLNKDTRRCFLLCLQVSSSSSLLFNIELWSAVRITSFSNGKMTIFRNI